MDLRLTPVSLAEIMGTWAGRSIRKVTTQVGSWQDLQDEQECLAPG